jgi:hypothetical protein
LFAHGNGKSFTGEDGKTMERGGCQKIIDQYRVEDAMIIPRVSKFLTGGAPLDDFRTNCQDVIIG